MLATSIFMREVDEKSTQRFPFVQLEEQYQMAPPKTKGSDLKSSKTKGSGEPECMARWEARESWADRLRL